MVKCAVCDDNSKDRANICHILNCYFKKRNDELKITQYEDGESMIYDYKDGGVNCFDLIFLDIYMKKSHGVEIAKKVREYSESVVIIFVASTKEFAVDGYYVHAYGYLLKPIYKDDLTTLLDSFVRMFHKDRIESLLIKERGEEIQIPYNEIMYLESRTPYVYIYTTNNSYYRIHTKLSNVEKVLCERGFMRCHQSFIVNMAYVERAGTAFYMKNGIEIPLRRQEKKRLKEQFFKYIICN